jgi:hypothetical protein
MLLSFVGNCGRHHEFLPSVGISDGSMPSVRLEDFEIICSELACCCPSWAIANDIMNFRLRLGFRTAACRPYSYGIKKLFTSKKP